MKTFRSMLLGTILIAIGTVGVCHGAELLPGDVYATPVYREAYQNAYKADAFIVAAHGWALPLVFDTTDPLMLQIALRFRDRIKALTGEIAPFVDAKFAPHSDFISLGRDLRAAGPQPDFSIFMRKSDKAVGTKKPKSMEIRFGHFFGDESANRAMNVFLSKIQLGGDPKFPYRVAYLPWEFTDIQKFRNPGDGQPATEPVEKVPAKIQPSSPTSEGPPGSLLETR